MAGVATAGLCDFYGITLQKRGDQDSEKQNDDTLCLVFARATKGSLTEFLEQYERKDDWGVILEILEGVANGLQSLHGRGIAHR